MAWRRSGEKPLSEPMMVRLPTNICVTRPQWVKRRAAVIFDRKIQKYSYNKSMFGTCSTPWPAKISIQEQHWMQFLESKWWPNVLETQGQWPPFSIPAERIPRCIFGTNLVFLAQITSFQADKPIFLEFNFKWPKWTPSSRLMTSIFITSQ